MARVTQQRTRQALLVVGEPLDPYLLPEKFQLYNELGEALSIPIGHRREVTKTTEVLEEALDTGKLTNRGPGGSEAGSWNMGIGVILTKISVSKPSRVRFYTSSDKRDADFDRDRYTDPMDYGGMNMVPDHGCLSEFLFLSFTSLENIPADYLVSGGGEPTIYYTIENYDLTEGAITVTLTIKDVEQ
jgi:hypothetical protein